MIEKYGKDYTKIDYLTNPAIGRDEEIKELIVALLTPEKSAILVGKPGVGKTAIIEGLGYLIKRNEVPDALKGYHLINIQTASLLGTLPNGESKINLLIEELKQEEKVILFIDEIHMLINSNNESALDFANIFKEGLGRGAIKIVGATTDYEYQNYVLRDKAFNRRFQKIDVAEPSREETIQILLGTLPSIEAKAGIKLDYPNFIREELCTFIVDITSEYKRVYELGSRYPDCSLTLLNGAFSEAIFLNQKKVEVKDVLKAIENSTLIYPDVIEKGVVEFKEKFKDFLKEDKVNVAFETEDETNPFMKTFLDPLKEDSMFNEIPKPKSERKTNSLNNALKTKEQYINLDDFFK